MFQIETSFLHAHNTKYTTNIYIYIQIYRAQHKTKKTEFGPRALHARYNVQSSSKTRSRLTTKRSPIIVTIRRPVQLARRADVGYEHVGSK
jgi:hypothetical protein